MDNHKQGSTEMTDAEVEKLIWDFTHGSAVITEWEKKLAATMIAGRQRIEGLERELFMTKEALTDERKECDGRGRELSAERNARAKAEAKVAEVEKAIETKTNNDAAMLRQVVLKTLATQSPEPAAASAAYGSCRDCCHSRGWHHPPLGGLCKMDHCDCKGYIDMESPAPQPEAAKCEHPDASHWTDGLGNKGLNCPNCGRVFVTREAPQPSQALRDRLIKAITAMVEPFSHLQTRPMARGSWHQVINEAADAIIALIEARHAK